MALFKIDVTLLYLLMICIAINIVQADPKDDDVEECKRQIEIAYKSDTSTGCYRFAVQHYKKGKHISVDERLVPGTSDQSLSVSSPKSEDFVEADSFINYESLGSSSSKQEDSVRDYQSCDGPSSEHEVTADSEPHKNMKDKKRQEERQNYPNYATAYFSALENMAQGNNICAPLAYCIKVYNNNPECRAALKIFGNTPKSAARVALTHFTLAECADRPIVHSYLLFISQNVEIIKPSKKPSRFCRDIHEDADWYLELKASAKRIKTI